MFDKHKPFSLCFFDSSSTIVAVIINGMLHRNIRSLSRRHLSAKTDAWLLSRSPALLLSIKTFSLPIHSKHAQSSSISSQSG